MRSILADWVMSRLPAPCCFWVTACTTTRRSRRLRQPAEGCSHCSRPSGAGTRPAGTPGSGTLEQESTRHSGSSHKLKPLSHHIFQRRRAPAT